MDEEEQEPSGQLFILSGPSGSGKDTLLSCLLKKYPDIRLSVSMATRPPRAGEHTSPKYQFVAPSHFIHMLHLGDLLEYTEYLGNYYGTPKKPVMDWLREGRDVILEIDVIGAAKIRQIFPDAISIFILPPSLDTLRERLDRRHTEDRVSAYRRMRAAVDEVARAQEYDYVIVNDDLQEAVNDLAAVIHAHRFTARRMKTIIDGVLENAQSFHWKTT